MEGVVIVWFRDIDVETDFIIVLVVAVVGSVVMKQFDKRHLIVIKKSPTNASVLKDPSCCAFVFVCLFVSTVFECSLRHSVYYSTETFLFFQGQADKIESRIAFFFDTIEKLITS